MKLLSIILLNCLTISCCLGQVFYKSSSDKEFKALMKNGLTYIKSGDSIADELYIDAFKENWAVTEFNVFDPKDADVKLTENDIVVFEAKINESESILALIELKHILDGTASKYATIGYICLNGFNQESDVETKKMFIPQLVSGLNDVVKVISDNEINSGGVSLYKSIYKGMLPKTKALKNKTLLIVDKTVDYIDLDGLEKHGIKYKKVTLDEYTQLIQEDASSYCLMYFAYNSYTEISIYDLENNDLIYTRHFAGGKSNFDSSEAKDVAEQFGL